MGLASAMSTALTGLTASETTIDVVGNNLANSNTVGFKASTVSFATQFLQTRSLGSAPTANNGGTDPTQVGLGTMVAEISPNFSQGTVETSSSPTDLAIQGDGFFIVQGKSNESLYSRNGVFKLNSENQLINSTGNRLLGYGVDDQYAIQSTTLVPMSIPLGSKSVSKATANAYLQGTLSPTGNVSTAGEVIETAVLTDAAYSRPDTVETASTPANLGWGASNPPTQAQTAGSKVPAGTYYYKVVYSDGPNGSSGANESLASDPSSSITVAAGGAPTTVSFDGVPADPNYAYARLYRTSGDKDTGTYYYVGQTPNGFTASGATAASATGGSMKAGDTYHYRFVWANSSDVELAGGASTPASAVSGTVGTGDNAVQLSGLDTMPGNPLPATYTKLHVYRTKGDPTSGEFSDYYYVGSVATGTSTFKDTTADASLSQKLSTSVNLVDNADASGTQSLDTTAALTGSYTYYVTFINTNGLESRPSDAVNVTVSNGRVHLDDFPVGDSTQWSGMRIYRSRNGDASNFYRIAEFTGASALNGSLSYTDSASDASITDSSRILSFNGPPIQSSTLLSNILRRDSGTNYVKVFDIPTADAGVASLQFTGRKGGRSLHMETFSINATSTAAELGTFMEESLGIQRPPGPDSAHPIPQSTSPVTGGAPLDAGSSITADGRFQLVGNNGKLEAISIDLSAMKLITSKSATNVNMPFSSIQSAVGESAETDFIAYDSLGIQCNVSLTAVLESRTSSLTTYRWYADSPDNSTATGLKVSVGTGLITFDGQGNFVTSYGSTVSIERANLPSASPLEFQLDFSQLSGLAANSSSLSVSRQDGAAPGALTSFLVGADGLISGVFSNGLTRDLGQIRLARFANPAGLEQQGENLFSTGVNSGLPVQGNPNQNGIGSIVAGAEELSNTDIGSNLIDLILASTMYRGNSQVISTVQQMLDTLLSLRR